MSHNAGKATYKRGPGIDSHNIMQKSEKPIIKHIADFLDYCEVEKGLADKTQENYKRYLEKFISWLKASGKTELSPHELTSKDIWNFRLYLSRHKDEKGRVLKKITQNYYLIALRAFLTYFAAKDIVCLPSDKIALPKGIQSEKTVKFLNLEQIEKLLLSPNVETPAGLRDRTILEALFSSGLRIAELTALERNQFANIKDRKDFELSIIGKGGYPRTVYFSERALAWLKKYLNARSDKEKALFNITPRSIERIVKRHTIVAGVPFFTTPHTLRHSMATDLLNQGVDIRMIQEFLGHRSITSTQIYTHVTSKRLRDIHRQFHSGKNLKE